MTLRLGLGFGPTQRPGGRGSGPASAFLRLAGAAGPWPCVGLGPAARGRARGCTGARRGLWSVGWVYVDLVHPLSSPLRSMARRVQPGGSLLLLSPAPFSHDADGQRHAPVVLRCTPPPLLFHSKQRLDFRSLYATRVASLFPPLADYSVLGRSVSGRGPAMAIARPRLVPGVSTSLSW